MDTSCHGDENTASPGEHSSTTKRPENLDSPQFQEIVRGFMVEKELLEKRHKEEIEKLKDNFSKKEDVVSENHDEQVCNRESEFSQFNQRESDVMRQTQQAHMMANGNR